MTTRTATVGQDVLEQTHRILAGSAEPGSPAPSACCSNDKQEVCCETSQKVPCCGTDEHTGGGCGCQ